MKISWSSKYSIGIEEIDQQHMRLFELLDELDNSTYNKEFKGISNTILTALTEYVYTHFSLEEALMKEIDYPNLSEHQLIHEALRNKVDYEIQLNKDDEFLTLKIIHLHQFLKDWIITHIIEEDSKIAAYRKGLDIK